MDILCRLTIPATALMLTACISTPAPSDRSPLDHDSLLPTPNVALQIDGLSQCTHKSNHTIDLNADEPVTVIVHGCNSSAGRFRALADVYAFHGQQTVCFNYDDRDSISRSAGELNAALSALTRQMRNQDITVIGHSQGGLVARHALTHAQQETFSQSPAQFTLSTISGPFNGIESSTHCGYTWLHVVSFGLSTAACQIITGSKWTEITPSSRFINEPAALNSRIARYLKINTDETNTCRRYDDSGERCLEDDFVFSLREQQRADIGPAELVQELDVKAGHVEIVGDAQTKPDKLIAILQEQHLLRNTPADRRVAFNQLLERLYAQ